MRHSFVDELRRLDAGHPAGPDRSRVREIILRRRQALLVRDDGTLAGPPALSDFDGDDMARARAIAGDLALGVGLVVAETGTGDRPVGTAFRVKGHPRRMLTCRHLLAAMLRPGIGIAASHPFRALDGAQQLGPGEGLYPCRLEFTPTLSRRVDPSLVWIHPRWDLMLFDLADPAPGEVPDDQIPALEIEVDRHWGTEGWGDRICVIGFPSARPNEQVPHPFHAGLGLKYLSPGVRKRDAVIVEGAAGIEADASPGGALHPDATSFLGRHDASTLPGNSGSPVISLRTGLVIGVHATPGEFARDAPTPTRPANGYVMLAPALDREPALRHEIVASAPPTGSPVAWVPPVAGDLGAGEATRPLVERLFEDGSDILQVIAGDIPDARDAEYLPAFSVVPDRVFPSGKSLPPLREQAGEDCVGHAVATALEIALSRAKFDTALHPVSARMIYESARLFDDFILNRLGGSSLRGALKGLFHSGVCTGASEPDPRDPWLLSIDRAREAREVRLTAYYRLRANIADIQHAVHASGAVVVSAHIHHGWKPENANGRIPWPAPRTGRHAFVIVGYDRDGWYVRNSWGKGWSSVHGVEGIALWTYEDWRENMLDAWVLQVAPRTPKAFEVPAWVHRAAAQAATGDASPGPLAALPVPRRHSLIGHALQVERDAIAEGGRLGLGLAGFRETALYLGSRKGRRKYRRISILCHDPFLSESEVARLSGELVGPFKRDGMYPLNLAYGLDETRTIRLRMEADARQVTDRAKGSREPEAILARAARGSAPLMRIFREGLTAAAAAGGTLWQLVLSLSLETGMFGTGRRKRPLTLIAFGAGSLVADAIEQALNVANAGSPAIRLDIAGVSRDTRGSAQVAATLRADCGPNPALHGIVGDWLDLVTAAAPDLGGHRTCDGTHAFAAELYADYAARLRGGSFDSIFAPAS